MMYAIILAMLAVQAPADATATAAANPPKLSLPPQVTAVPGKPFVVKLETECKWIRWTVPPGLERVDPSLTSHGTKAFVGYGPAGVYEFKVEGTKDDVFNEATCFVYVGQKPGPPIPPSPPGPSPGPLPSPGDPLAAELQLLFSANVDPNKYAQRDFLRDVYLLGVLVAKDGKVDPSVTTKSQLRIKLAKAADFPIKLKPNDLIDCRRAIKVEIEKCLSVDGPLDAIAREEAAACLERIARCLSALK